MTVTLITGAAGGIGSSVADRLARTRTVIRSDLGIPSASPDWRACDVTDRTSVEEMVAEVEAEHGPIHELVHAAGVLTVGPALEASDTSVAQMLAVNVLGTINVLTAVARRMTARRGGAIVAVTSNAGRVPRSGMSSYSASKAAAEAFSHSFALEVAAHGVRINTVAPGSTRTGMLTSPWAQGSDEARLVEGSLSQFKLGIPLGRIAEPDDVAAAVEFLLSSSAAHITMQSITVDGGASLGR